MQIEFIPKRTKNSEPWLDFGCTDRFEYELWVPHICGICCVKMLTDSLGLTKEVSLYDMTICCYKLGGFKFTEDGNIKGVFHEPLLQLARLFGLDGELFGRVAFSDIFTALQKGFFVILSVDLERAGVHVSGSHLVLIHSWDAKTQKVILNDCSSALGTSGHNLEISCSRLDAISNGKGLTLWKV